MGTPRELESVGKAIRARRLCNFESVTAEVPGPLIFGNLHKFTIRQLAVKWLQRVGSELTPIESHRPSDDRRQCNFDISLPHRTLDCRPKEACRRPCLHNRYLREKLVSNRDSPR